MHSIEAAAIFCSVPFHPGISAESLRHALMSGNDSDENLPYLDRLLNEAPIEMLGGVLNDFQQSLLQKRKYINPAFSPSLRRANECIA